MKTLNSKYSDLKNNKTSKKLYTFGRVDDTNNYFYDKFPDGYTPLFFYRSLEDYKQAEKLLNEIDITFSKIVVIEDTYDQWQSQLLLA